MSAPAEDLRAATLAAFATLLGLPPLARLGQRGRDPETARYTLTLADGRDVRIGTIRVLWSQTELARVLAVTVGCVPPVIDRDGWRNAIAALVANAVEVDEAPGERFEDTVREWLLVYAEHAGGDREGAAPRGLPFCDGGLLHVAASGLARFVRREFSEQVKLTELRQALADLGAERCNISYTKRDGNRSSTSYYRVDVALLEQQALEAAPPATRPRAGDAHESPAQARLPEAVSSE
jgi:hypothetical protein